LRRGAPPPSLKAVDEAVDEAVAEAVAERCLRRGRPDLNLVFRELKVIGL
jgi:hypothetical protein